MAHSVLQIIQGIPPIPGDSQSALGVLDSINFIFDENATGLVVDDWLPAYPGYKRGGIFSESAITDGAILTAAAEGNVTEKLVVRLVGASRELLYGNLADLEQMKRACVAYWTDSAQTDPVYLKHQYVDEPGPRYALLYTIEFDVEDEQRSALEPPVFEVSLTLVREPYWRSVPPGANPKLWTFERSGIYPSSASYNLSGTTNDLVNATIQNRHELSLTSAVTPLSKNFIDIEPSQIAGDAPALLMISVTDYQGVGLNIGVQDRETRYTDRNPGTPIEGYAILNAGDSDGGAAALNKTIDAAGVISNGSAVSKYIRTGSVIFGSSWREAMVWRLPAHLFRGRYMALLRHSQEAGAAGDIRFRLRVTYYSSSLVGGTLTPAMEAKTQGAGAYTPLVGYLGQIQIPYDGKTDAAQDGLGPKVNTTAAQKTAALVLEIFNGAGANRDVNVSDLILIPVDFCAGRVLGGFGGNPNLIIDNTHYLSGGYPEVRTSVFSAIAGQYAMEYQGQELYLRPGVQNRVHFFYEGLPSLSMVVSINIVPRWVGARSV